MSNEVPPPIRVLQMLMGMWVAQMTAAAARFGVADQIAQGVTSSDELARAVEADPTALYRLLRACATVGLFVETEPKVFANTPLGECLRTGVPGSVREFLIAETAPGHWLPWGRLYDAVKSGRSFANDVLGMDAWEYYAKNHDEALTFARGMGNLSALVAQDVVRLYDPSPFALIVDVGGSQGVLLNGLLNIAPNARGILFDRPEIIADVVPSERVKVVGGDFFDEIPAGGDLYLLKSILHDWPDDRCDAILRNVHRAARDGAHLLVVETILPEAPEPSPVTFMDLNMLVMLGGRERKVAEYGGLLRSAGFEMVRVIPTGGMFGLIEARKL
ncbi:MAG TPA: methyltransferase [Thermoanaerobaculia bacterium]|nr:methyltransferase [Thermoanaerobaculia bacterium]